MHLTELLFTPSFSMYSLLHLSTYHVIISMPLHLYQYHLRFHSPKHRLSSIALIPSS